MSFSLLSFFPFKSKAASKKLLMVSYNLQQGKKPWEFVEKILQQPCDIFCFQRFPEKWLSNITLPHSYQPSYPGAGSGCLSISKKGKFKKKGYTFERSFKSSSQGVSYIEAEVNKFHIINTLPPFLDEDATLDDYVKHLKFIFKEKGNRIIVGDFHFPDRDMPKIDFNGFKNYSKSENFFEKGQKGLNLTKLFSNYPIKTSERLLDKDTSPTTHNPVFFEINT